MDKKELQANIKILTEEESREIIAARHMAWERAKGELTSMLWTYYTVSASNKYGRMEVLIDEFVESVEGGNVL